MTIQPLIEDDELLLRPLKAEDFGELWKIASDTLLWEQHPAKERASLDGFKKWFSEAASALVIIKSGEVIGTSRYRPLAEHPNVVEIGWTFIKRELWGTGINARVKAMMLKHAFEQFEQVVFFVDVNNFRSQQAVLKLGARRVQHINGVKIEDRPTGGAVFCLDKVDFTGF